MPKPASRYGYSNSISGRMVRIQTSDGPVEHEATGDQLRNGWGWPIYCEFLRIDASPEGSRTVTIASKAEAIAAGGPPDWIEYLSALEG